MLLMMEVQKGKCHLFARLSTCYVAVDTLMGPKLLTLAIEIPEEIRGIGPVNKSKAHR